ncbi:hypothetical protein C7380_10244 [Oceanotoga teriensis]|uniref:Haloacid dehalogenase n=1 Tax=Oceanotoga teriensis TaxID=515440 RepID=A0AA45HJN6_9BACT|nr:YqeG family HAD IIIA-type phosphatase [Oceanotoga teriensis]PWJ96135.1 hypothetical protein C7380_10244 [Oceanotoga teriensis]
MSHTTGLFKYIPIPREHKPDIYSIDYKKMKKWGITTILFDYDFTVTVWKEKKITNKTLELFERLLDDGFKVAIVTNAKKERAIHIEERTKGKVRVFSNMKKPGIKKLKDVLNILNSQNSKTMMIGDLFITDVFAGNKLGLYTILINPYTYQIDSKFKKFMANFSKFVYFIFFYTIGWFFRLMDLAVPNEFKDNIFGIDYDHLKKTNHKLIIFDFDNTLVAWHSKNLNSKSKDLFAKLKGMGFEILIATNGRDSRFDSVKSEISEFDIKIQTLSLKPFNFKLKKKVKLLGYKPRECVLIGDQLFTDITAGNSSGFYTIKVNPISKKEGKWTKFIRNFEKLSIKMMRKKPTLFKGEDEI